VSKKLLFATGLSVLLGGTAFYALSAPAAIQFGPPQNAQTQAEKDMLDRQMKEANKRRQQDIRNDTDKLLQLATELKSSVDKSNENLLSLEVVRKADEVEKLAHRVKEKMREAVGPPLRSDPPSAPRPPQ
jgi:uncharacterized protein YlxW (UPF0749 family)